MRGGSAETHYKPCYTETITLLNTCSYTDYETDILNNGECAKFAVDADNLTFRVPLLKETETTDELFEHFVVVANGQTNKAMMDWSAWASSLKGRLNTDVTNITAVGRTNITDMLNPDYSAGVEKVWGETYTADVSGWLYYAIRFATNSSSTIDDYTCLWIDEVPVGVGGGQKGTSASCNSGLVKIGKGSTYRTADPAGTGYSTQCIKFYPDKGVN